MQIIRKIKRLLGDSDRRTLKWLWARAKNQTWKIILLVIISGISALFSIAMAFLCRALIDCATAGDRDGLLRSIAGLIGLMLTESAVGVLDSFLSESCSLQIRIGLQEYFLEMLVRKQYAPLADRHTGDLQNRMFSDVEAITGGLVGIVPSIIYLIFKLVGAAVSLAILMPQLLILAMTVGIIAFLGVTLMRNVSKRLHKNVQEKEGELRSDIQEILGNLLIIKVFGAGQQMLNRARISQNAYRKARLIRRAFGIVAGTGFGLFFSGAYFGAMAWGAFAILQGTMTFGTLTAVLQLVGQVQSPFSGFSGIISQMYSVLASAERIMELEDLPEEQSHADFDSSERYEKLDEIQVRNISFTYGRTPVLENADLTLHKGDVVSIRGISGGGKSSLFLLLMGIYAPTDGSISFCFADGEQSPDEGTRMLFAYVPQGNGLMTGTLRENVAFFREDVSDDAIREALHLACADSFVAELPQGLDTLLGERGHGLSAGQMQRVAIARAILSGAPILMLDEATSALDEATEAQLLENIRQLQNRTCLIVTHRPAALGICTRHVQIRDGHIEEV